MLIYFLVSILFMVFFFIFIIFLNFYMKTSFEEKTFFECGFDALQSYRSLFSLRFFSVSVVFLIFDMEIMFILPLIYFYDHFKFIFFVIYFVLLLGVYLEWSQGGLDWK